MRYLIGILAALAAVALGVWLWMSRSDASPTPKGSVADLTKFDSDFADLLGTTFVTDGGSALELDDLAELLPEKWMLTYDATDFDGATGATTIKGFELTHADMDGAALKIDQVSTWGFDADLLQARIAGEKLDTTAVLAKRIDLSGVEISGLASAYQPLMDAAMEAIDSMDSDDIDVLTTIDRYDFKMDRLVIDTATLHPWSWVAVTPEQMAQFDETIQPGDLKAMHFAQTYAAFLRAYSIEGFAVENVSVDTKITQLGAQTGSLFLVARGGARGLDRGDMASMVLRDMTFTGTTAMPDVAGLTDDMEGEEFDPTDMMKPVPISGSIELYAVEGLRMTNLLDHLARGQWPDASETDLISFGVFTGKDLTYSLNDKPFYSLENVRYDASGFHGFAPTKIDIKIDNLVYHVDTLLELFAPELNAMEGTKDGMQVVENVMTILQKYDLGAPSIDLQMGWTWDEDKGVGDAMIAYGVDGMTRIDTRINMQTPTYAEMMPHLKFTGDDPVDGPALEELFERKFALNSASWVTEDEGGIDKVLSMIPEIAAVLPDQSPQMEVMASYKPETLRQMAVGGLQLVGGEAKKEAPQLEPLFDGFAAFMQNGGRLEIRIDPPQPLTPQLVESLEAADLEPERQLDALGLKVIHTKPE